LSTSDLVITAVAAVALVLAGLWCRRRNSGTKLGRWLRLQAFALFALVPAGIAAGLDTNDAYSAALGRFVGSALVLYLIVTAILVVVRSSRPVR